MFLFSLFSAGERVSPAGSVGAVAYGNVCPRQTAPRTHYCAFTQQDQNFIALSHTLIAHKLSTHSKAEAIYQYPLTTIKVLVKILFKICRFAAANKAGGRGTENPNGRQIFCCLRK